MNLAVIGEPCIDYISINGKMHEKEFGGIFYSLLSLSHLAGKNDQIFPVFYAGKDEYSNLIQILSGIDNIKTSGIKITEHDTRKVNLYYGSSGLDNYDREENSTFPVPEVKYEMLEPFLNNLDGILINMVSGEDININT